jgi:hypothetical protein
MSKLLWWCSPALSCCAVQRQAMYTQLQEFLPVMLLSKLGPANEAVQHTLTLLLNKPCTQHTTPWLVMTLQVANAQQTQANQQRT